MMSRQDEDSVTVGNDEDWREENNPKQYSRLARTCGYCYSGCSSVAFYAYFSWATMLIALALFLASLRQHNHKDDKIITESDIESMRSYWTTLVETVIPAGEIVLPGLASYRALQWMVLRDPLRPLLNEDRIRQRYTLVFLYYSWAGQKWPMLEGSGWPNGANNLTVTHECNWEGVLCNQDHQVISLELDDDIISLRGSIPSQLASLTALQKLVLPNHGLKGSIPSELSQLTELRQLDLNANQLTSMDLANLPLKSLEELILSTNDMKGKPDFRQLEENAQHLRILHLSKNVNLLGEINLSSYQSLEDVQLYETLLNITLAEDMGKLTSLETLDIVSPFGTIPVSIGNCTNLRKLRLDGKSFPGALHGTIPTEVGYLTKLTSLEVSNAPNVASVIPTETSLLTSLVSLRLSDAGTPQGTLPTELAQLFQLKMLRISRSRFVGTVPQEYGSLTDLELFNLVGTQITGSMPANVCALGIPDLFASCKAQGNASSTRFQCNCCTCF